MTQSRKRNNLVALFVSKLNSDPYLVINLIFSGVIIIVFVYSGLFSPRNDNYPIVCIHEKLTGEPCVSCGLSHSFSLIIRGKIAEAFEWNIYGMRIFIFFTAQLLMRVFFSIFYLKYQDVNRQLLKYDIVVSGMLFIICFMPFIEWIFSAL